MRIGELSSRTAVPARLLRYYEEQGLLSPERGYNGYREYPEAAVERVEQIRGLIDSGIPTRIIRQLLPCLSTGASSIFIEKLDPDVVESLAEQQQQLDRRIGCLTRNRDAIARYLAAAAAPQASAL
ncbi:MerR family transcriptional regulator [Microterricola viridarii]|uniref:MerR family transcriptional regulator n=1 Tax=Microterricola viridarii TaxID=412690 RepID=A0A0Y0NJY2_9MICO|nr:MerR family transcriptional regulator [Microterricola viridarii]AMB60085.1 MerR family transcriptional regulator [Microterricola viridarii]